MGTEKEYRFKFGKVLERRLNDIDMSQATLSHITGISQPAISNYIRGRRTPSIYIADLISKTIGLELKEFIPKSIAPEDF